MGDLRNRLDRKSELRLYEWMKSAENYQRLSNKTIPEGAVLVSQELDMKVSSSVLVSLVQAMDLKPFWQTKPPREVRPMQQQALGLDALDALMPRVHEALTPLQEKVKHASKRLDHQAKSLEQLKAVCQNLMTRIEAQEQGEKAVPTKQRRGVNGSTEVRQ